MFDFINLPILCQRIVIDYLDLKSFLSLILVSKETKKICDSTLPTRTVNATEIGLKQNAIGQWSVLTKKTNSSLPITMKSLPFGVVSTSVLDISFFLGQTDENREASTFPQHSQSIGCFPVLRRNSPKKEKFDPVYCSEMSEETTSSLPKEIWCFLGRLKCTTLWLRAPEETEHLTRILKEVIQLLKPNFLFGQHVGQFFPIQHQLSGVTGIFKTDVELLACNALKIMAYKATNSLSFSTVNQLISDCKNGRRTLHKLQISWNLQSPNALDHLLTLLEGLGAEQIEAGRTAYRIRLNDRSMIFAINSHSVKFY